MKFGIAKSERFWQKLRFEVTKEDGSKRTEQIEVQYKRLPKRESTAAIRDIGGVDDGDLIFLTEVVTDWRTVTDENGADVPFNKEALEAYYDAGMGPVLVQGYFRGNPQAKEKN